MLEFLYTIFNMISVDVSDLLAFAAIIISVVTAIAEWLRWKKEQKIGLEMEYYKSVFDDFLLKTIPEKRDYIFYDLNGKLNKQYKHFCKELTLLRKKSAVLTQDTRIYTCLCHAFMLR